MFQSPMKCPCIQIYTMMWMKKSCTTSSLVLENWAVYNIASESGGAFTQSVSQPPQREVQANHSFLYPTARCAPDVGP